MSLPAHSDKDTNLFINTHFFRHNLIYIEAESVLEIVKTRINALYFNILNSRRTERPRFAR